MCVFLTHNSELHCIPGMPDNHKITLLITVWITGTENPLASLLDYIRSLEHYHSTIPFTTTEFPGAEFFLLTFRIGRIFWLYGIFSEYNVSENDPLAKIAKISVPQYMICISLLHIESICEV